MNQPCKDQLGRLELIVRLEPAGPAMSEGLLGDSLVDLEAKQGVLATIYADRVQLTAIHTGIDAGVLLGRTIAHELVHLLLGTAVHAEHGLMRARWSEEELRHGRDRDWMLSPHERETLAERVRLRARGGSRPEPVAVVTNRN